MSKFEIIGIVAGIIAILGYVPYIVSTVQGKTKPHQATWFIWTLVGLLLASSYGAEGDKNAIWVPISYFLGPLLTALLSLKYGYPGWSRLDKICFISAIISIIPWLLSKDATATLLINVLIDAFGAIPTLVKAYHEPETEDLSAWSIFLIANTIELFAITEWNVAATYPLYLFVLVALMVILILRKKIVVSIQRMFS